MGSSENYNNKKENIAVVYGDSSIEKHGNSEVKTLAKVYKELSKNGLTKEEMNVLTQLDYSLQNVEIKVPTNDCALLIQKDKDHETIFVVESNPDRPNTKPTRTK